MKTFLSCMLLIALLSLAPASGGATVSAASIPNWSFEENSGWTFSTNGMWWNFAYYQYWYTHGSRSMMIYIPAGDQGCDQYPGANTYGQVTAQADLTDAYEIRFDLSTYGSWDVPGLGPNYYHSFELLVDNDLVYSMERQAGTYYNLVAPIEDYVGTHTLTIRMRNHADFCSSQDRGLRIDSLIVVAEKVSVPVIYRQTNYCNHLPTLISPANGSQLNHITPLFEWNGPIYQDETTVRVTASTSPNFNQNNNTVWSMAHSGVGSFRFPRNFIPGTTYFWRANYVCGSVHGPYTAVRTFTTGSGGTFPATPVHVSPANNAALAGTSVTLDWQTVTGAVDYVVFWRRVGSSSAFFSTVTASQITLTHLTPSATYAWNVAARNNYAYSNYSTEWQFTTGARNSLPRIEDFIPFGRIETSADGQDQIYIIP